MKQSEMFNYSVYSRLGSNSKYVHKVQSCQITNKSLLKFVDTHSIVKVCFGLIFQCIQISISDL